MRRFDKTKTMLKRGLTVASLSMALLWPGWSFESEGPANDNAEPYNYDCVNDYGCQYAVTCSGLGRSYVTSCERQKCSSCPFDKHLGKSNAVF